MRAMLIKCFAKGTDAVLDIGCGKGPDTGLWINENVSYVRGIDASVAAVATANAAAAARMSTNEQKTKVEFDVVKVGELTFRDDRVYDCVSSMNSVESMFGSESAASAMMSFVSASLKDNGIFFGVLLSGKRVMSLLNGDHTDPTSTIHRAWVNPECFGSPYFVTDQPCCTENFSLRFLVFDNVLTKVAARHGLFPIEGGNEFVSTTESDGTVFRRTSGDTSALVGFALRKIKRDH